MNKTILAKLFSLIIVSVLLISSLALPVSAAFTMGDANKDSSVNILDLVCLKKHIANSEYSVNEVAVDYNGDEALNSSDLTSLVNQLLGIEEEPFEVSSTTDTVANF